MPTNIGLTVPNVDIYEGDIMWVQLDQSVEGHHVLRVMLNDDFDQASSRLKYGEPCLNALGETIVFKYESDEDAESWETVRKQHKSLVTEVTFDHAVDGDCITWLTAHGPTYAMDQARRNRVFEEQKVDAIIKRVLGDYGLQHEVEATSDVVPYCVQYQETDYAFIKRLAAAAGLWAYYDGDKFLVRKAKTSSDDSTLVWPSTMSAFKIVLGMRGEKFDAQTFNYIKKESFRSETSGSLGTSLSSAQQKVHGSAESAFPNSSYVHGLKAESQGGLDRTLKPIRNGAVGKMFRAMGGLRSKWLGVGTCFSAEGVGPAIAGTYFVKSVRFQHPQVGPGFTVVDEDSDSDQVTLRNPPAGWEMQPWQEDLDKITARTNSSGTFVAVPLEAAYPEVIPREHRFTDIQPATVASTEDPDELGRVQVKYMWNDGTSQAMPDHWVRVMTPHGGSERGFFCLPEIDDEVLVAFERGDPDRPIVIGSLYNGRDKPPTGHPAGFNAADNDLKVWRTKADNEIYFSDVDGKEMIGIVQKDGENSITLSMDGPTITIESKGDITIKGKGITIEGDSIAMESKTGDITMKSAAALKAESTADMELKGGMNLKAEGGMNADLKAGIGATVDSMNTTVKGATMVTVQGAIVKIN